MADETTTTTAATTTTTPTLPTLPENWHSMLPDDLKSEESLKLIKDIPSMAKSYIHAQKNFGADKIALPTKYSTEEEIRSIYTKLGVPAELKDYAIEAPKDLGLEGERLDGLRAVAHKVGISQKQLQAVLGWSQNDAKIMMENAKAKMTAETNEGIELLKKEWGSAFEQKTAQAQFIVKHLNDPDLNKYLDETGLGNHPKMVKVFAKMAEMLAEGKVKEGDGATNLTGAKTPEVAKKEIMSIQGNYQHPYYDSKHPAHELAVKEVQALYKMAYPGT